MTDPSILRQKERERREWMERAEERQRLERERLEAEQQEQRRIAQLKNQWASITAARANDQLAAHQRATYYEKAQRLIRLIDGD